jgi:hypothetical protein
MTVVAVQQLRDDYIEQLAAHPVILCPLLSEVQQLCQQLGET